MAICASTAGIDMTQDEIIQIARPYEWLGVEGWTFNHYWELEAFAKLVAAKALSEQQRNFCPRCGKRTADLTTIHTCTPPQD
jgi:hypothetical protein